MKKIKRIVDYIKDFFHKRDLELEAKRREKQDCAFAIKVLKDRMFITCFDVAITELYDSLTLKDAFITLSNFRKLANEYENLKNK